MKNQSLKQNYLRTLRLFRIWGTSFSVCEFRELQDTDGEFIVEGFIGGRKNPFVENRAIFILGDESLETCDEKDNDTCPHTLGCLL